MADHDIMRGSHAWERIQHGIPANVQPQELRTWMHDWVSIAQVLVPTVNALLDADDEHAREVERALVRAQEHVAAAKRAADEEHARIHQRIDRRGEDINALGAASQQRHDALVERLFDSERGSLHKLATKAAVAEQVKDVEDKVVNMTRLLWTVLVAVTGSAIMLAMNLAAKGGV